MQNSKKIVKNIFKAKEKRRQELACLPVEEKVKILVELQKIAVPILVARGFQRKPWKI